MEKTGCSVYSCWEEYKHIQNIGIVQRVLETTLSYGWDGIELRPPA